MSVPSAKKQTFDQLSDAERAVVGRPDDYDWENAEQLPARARPSTVQFSLRIDRQVFEAVQRMSAERGSTFSESVREAIERYVRSGGRPAFSNVQVTFSPEHQLIVQVAGAKAEPPSNRRSYDPDERTALKEAAVIP